jgi:hypothetical protein
MLRGEKPENHVDIFSFTFRVMAGLLSALREIAAYISNVSAILSVKIFSLLLSFLILNENHYKPKRADNQAQQRKGQVAGAGKYCAVQLSATCGQKYPKQKQGYAL